MKDGRTSPAPPAGRTKRLHTQQPLAHLVVRLQVHVCELQQLPQLRGLVVVEYSFLEEDKGRG